MESYPIRTDLALESQERLKRDRGNVRGIRFFEEKKEKWNYCQYGCYRYGKCGKSDGAAERNLCDD